MARFDHGREAQGAQRSAGHVLPLPPHERLHSGTTAAHVERESVVCDAGVFLRRRDSRRVSRPHPELRKEFLTGVTSLGGDAPEYYSKYLNKESKTKFVRNTAYGFVHARKVLECHKQGDATDGVRESDPEVFVPGWSTNKAPLTVADGKATKSLTFGVEICADASNQRSGTKGYVDKTNDLAGVDVKIIVSAVLQQDDVYSDNCAKVLIHAASEARHSGVTSKAASVTVTRVQQQTYLGYDLSYYKIVMT